MTGARVALAQLPTPLVHAQRLSQAWGGPEIWIKRDDLTGFGLSGNKVRKLEFHVAAAQQAGATTLVTCGAVQSNHCRATAIVAAQVGLRCILLLRSTNGEPPQRIEGNHLLQRLAGAEVRFISYDEWEERERLMADVATEVSENGGLAWVMPAGASDQLGVAAFEHAAGELAEQLEANQVRGPITVWHASSSGGTTAGLAIGVARQGLDARVVGASVGKFGDELGGKVTSLIEEAQVDHPERIGFEIVDDHIGLGYGKTTDEELRVQIEASRLTGIIWDPTYTGKALFGLHQEIQQGRFGPDDRVVFWHTGGGFAAFAHEFPLD